MRRCLFILLLAACPLSAQTTTITISSAVQQSGLDRPGINIGGVAPYGQQQILKDFGMEVGGYFQPAYWQASWVCSSGGKNDTRHWYNNAAGSPGGYPANFWVGARYIAVNASTGTPYGEGIITASTSNTGTTGIEFTLGTPLTSACRTENQDMLIVKFANAAVGTLSPQQMLGNGVCPGASWDTSDTSPASANTYQSLKMQSGCSLNLYVDQAFANNTDTNATPASQYATWISIHGSYTASFKAKCLNACTITYNVRRLSGGPNYISGFTVAPAVNAASGAGWTTYTRSFDANEVGISRYGPLELALAVSSGTALVQDVSVIEGSTFSGNNTVYRDAFVRKLRALHPGSMRFMDGADWCSTVTDMTETASPGGLRQCGFNNYLEAEVNQGVPYWDKLQLCLLVGADCWITVGQLNQAADWTKLIKWLADSSKGPSAGESWTQAFAEAGYKIYLEDGNETWNTAAGPDLWAGNGSTYGYFLGLKMQAAKAARGYNHSQIKLVGDSWAAPGQGYGIYGWVYRALSAAGCSKATTSRCPDFVDNAPYMLNWLNNFDSSVASVSATGAPFLDEWAEDANVDSVPALGNGEQSMYENTSFVKNSFGVGTAVYEVNYSTTGGSANPSQMEMDQIVASVGHALATEEHLLLMQRDSGVTGPINVFLLAQNSFKYNHRPSPAVPMWGIERTLACGPGQLSSCSDVDRPISMAMQVVNNALGTNSNLMKIMQSGTPTFRYAGGQPQNGTRTILPNSAVPYVQAFAYADSRKSNWTVIVFNNNLSASEAVVLGGIGAPGSARVAETLFGNKNKITDHNENGLMASSSATPVVTMPSATVTTGNRYIIPAATMMVLTYSTSPTSAQHPANQSQLDDHRTTSEKLN